MKVLFILPEFYPNATGGISTFYQNLLPELVLQGCEVYVIHGSATHQGNEHFEYKGIRVYDLKPIFFEKYKKLFRKFDLFPSIRNNLSAAWGMHEQAKQFGKFDIIETTDFGWGFIPFVINQYNNLVVEFHASIGEITYHDPVPGKQFEGDLSRIIEISTLQRVENLITYGINTKKAWTKRLSKQVDYQLPAFQVNELEHSKDKVINKIYGIVVGRIQYWKGVIVLCEAVRHLGEHGPLVYWVGRDTQYRNTTMTKYLEENFSGIWKRSIIPLGEASKDRTLQYQANCDFVIVPSIWDVFNFTCIEAMALGKVIICSEGAGASDLISDGFNGFLYNNNDPKHLAEVIKSVMLLSSTERDVIGEKAKATILNELDPRRAAGKRIDWYKSFSPNKNYESNEWIEKWLSPVEVEDNIEGTLLNLPIKTLVKHTSKRLLDKIKK